MIRKEALVYAEQYAAQEEAQHSKGDGRSSIHYPALFLFLGDKVTPAIGPVLERCERKWDNAAGVLALHAAAQGSSEQGSGKGYGVKVQETGKDYAGDGSRER
ncbi:hypothetical protein [Paenibacillus ihuae]|uniref:hypothetical protein n=1 Tax=Paenibacillus ihuae TaxID=1232431 RepID=UPI0006D57E7D|nr:hypothetical protein [Paenibacillus ihuae]